MNKRSMIESHPLKIAIAGCGNRGRVYMNLLAEQPENFQIVAAADPVKERVLHIEEIAKNQNFESYVRADELLNAPKLADVLFICTQDSQHHEHAIKALQRGYDLVIEKPMASNIREILEIEKLACQFSCRVIVCHVLRYTSFYEKLKEIIAGGHLGEIITINASEGIEPWHFAHSYVRGHWSIMEKSSPTIVAKCCHDMDILHWLIGKKCERISSFGCLSFFTPANRHLQVEFPMFDPKRYFEPQLKVWLEQVIDHPDMKHTEILEWLNNSPWGRSVFECNNTAIDHQVLSLEFEGGTTATFTMNAFDEGRNYEISGTKARLRAGDFYKEHAGADIIITDHASRNVSKIDVIDQNAHTKYGGYHQGGDVGFAKALYQLLINKNEPLTSVTTSTHSHLMAFGAEESRRTNQIIVLDNYYQNCKKEGNALD